MRWFIVLLGLAGCETVGYPPPTLRPYYLDPAPFMSSSTPVQTTCTPTGMGSFTCASY